MIVQSNFEITKLPLLLAYGRLIGRPVDELIDDEMELAGKVSEKRKS